MPKIKYPLGHMYETLTNLQVPSKVFEQLKNFRSIFI